MIFQLLTFLNNTDKDANYFNAFQSGIISALNRAGVKVNIDVYEGGNVSRAKYNILQNPTLILIDVDNNKALRLAGYHTAKDVEDYFYQYFAKIRTQSGDGLESPNGDGDGRGDGSGFGLGLEFSKNVWLYIAIGSGVLSVITSKPVPQIALGGVAGYSFYQYYNAK